MKEEFSYEEVLKLAKEFEIDQSDMLETFLCELLDITPTELYERMSE